MEQYILQSESNELKRPEEKMQMQNENLTEKYPKCYYILNTGKDRP